MAIKLYQQCRRNTNNKKTIFHALCLYVGALLILLGYSYVVNICYRWLDQVHGFCLDSESDYMNLSWFAFHAHHKKGTSESNLAISSLLPLLEEQAVSPAMSRHSMDVISKTVQYLSPGQTPAMACDQSLFDITKQIQWISPNIYGEDLYVIMLGGLHIKMTAWKMVGQQWMDSSSCSDIETHRKVDSFLKAPHVSRTRHSHQVTAAAPYTVRCKRLTHHMLKNIMIMLVILTSGVN